MTSRSVSLTSALTVCKADGVIGREGGFAGAVVFSVVVVVVVVEAGCEVVMPLDTFLEDEGESTEAEAKAGAMTRGEETEEEEEP